MPISDQLATLVSSIYAANVSGASAVSYGALHIKAKRESSVKRAAYLGNAVSSTTQAVTHTLVAAGLAGARGLSETALAASGLSFLCSLPGAIETIQSLGQSKPKESVKEIYGRAKVAHKKALAHFQTSLLVTGPTLHDNILQLMYNLPLDIIQDKDHHNLFPSVHDKLARQKRGDALKFYKKHLASDDNKEKLIRSFKTSLEHINDETMSAPSVSIGEVASYLSLLDPEQDDEAIKAFSSLFNELLIPFRQTLATNIDCASAMDESNRALLTLMADTFTRRAHRKKMQAKKLNTAKHVLTGVGVVLGGALVVYSAGLSVPVTALLATKLASSSVGLLSTSVRLAKLVQQGAAAGEISQLLTAEAICELERSDLGAQLLKSSLADIEQYKSSLLEAQQEIKTLASTARSEAYEIKKSNLYLLKKFESNGTLKRLLEDERFLESISQKIQDGMDAPALYNAMIQEVDHSRSLDFAYQTTKLESLDIVTSLMMHSDELTRETFISMAKKGELRAYLSATLESSRKEAESCFDKVPKLEEQFDILTKLAERIGSEEKQVHLKSHMLAQKRVGDLSIEHLLRANDHLEIIEDSQEKVKSAITKAQETIKRLEGDTEVTLESLSPL